MHLPSFLITALLLVIAQSSYADTDWKSVTFDNDLFRGSDNGYTNGLYYSWVDINPDENSIWTNFLTQSFNFSLSNKKPIVRSSGYTLGQTMITPTDITIKNPDQREIPYSGLLILSNSSLYIYENYADYIGVSIGLVGPASLAGDSQKTIHSATGSTQPQGWNTQINNEIVFTIARKRSWKVWASDNGNMELLTSASLAAGTIQSHAKVSTMFMYGNNLGNSFASSLLSGSRSSNPISMGGGWFVFHSISTGYTANNIALDGNTFERSRSVKYQHKSYSAMTGIAYSWREWSFTLAFVDDNVITSSFNTDEATQYGTFTVGWVP
jgi:lipid A 3-O-deacylase